MVIGKERTSWYSDHPLECTCAACEARRADDRRFREMTQGRKVGRNESCPCGSGVKYKRRAASCWPSRGSAMAKVPWRLPYSKSTVTCQTCL